jgi:hypothetical protein
LNRKIINKMIGGEGFLDKIILMYNRGRFSEYKKGKR